MKCENCGGQMGLEDEVCPYCGTPNSMALQHQSDMRRFQQEYQRTQTDVIEKTSFMQQHGSWLVILAVLLVALVGGIILHVNAWDIGYSMREGNIARSAAEDGQVLDGYLESGDYGKFAGYYRANDISMNNDNPYQGLYWAASSYVDLVQYIAAMHNDQSYLFKPERISTTCEYMADDLNRIYTLEKQYASYIDEYLPADKKVYLEDIRDRTRVIAETYLGLTEEDIQEIPNMSEQKLAATIEEGIKL